MAYRVRGFARIAEHVRRHFSRNGQVVSIPDFDGDLTFYCDLSEHMASQIYWRGYYSEDQLRVLEKIIKPDSTFVDVGANHGEFTLFAAKRTRQGHVYAFEPAAENYQKLTRHVRENHFSHVKAINTGLGESRSEVEIYRSNEQFVDGTQNKGLHSQYVAASELEKSVRETIQIQRLDDFVEENAVTAIDVMKIDVEGAEMSVFKGGTESLKRFRPVILLEVCEKTCGRAGYTGRDLLSFLEPIGYRFERVVSLGRGRTEPLSVGQLEEFQNVVCWPVQP